MAAAITNVFELKVEIQRLQSVKTGQEVVLKQHFNSPKAILATIAATFSKPRRQVIGGNDTEDIFVRLSEKLLPLTLKKTLFRNSNFLIKWLVGIASNKAAPLINQKSVGGLWDKLKTALPNQLVHPDKP